jgi:hypothetical protein
MHMSLPSQILLSITQLMVRLGVRFLKLKLNFYVVCEFQEKENVFG